MHYSLRFITLVGLIVSSSPANAQLPTPTRVARGVYLDHGVIKWKDDKREVTLFGANYVLPSASDYRAAGYLGLDRKKLIEDDMAHFARMGWNGLRLTFWGDWENSDASGNLIANDHLDLLDYLVFQARQRGIYMLFSPIQTYNSGWPDALQDSTATGFSKTFQRGELGTSAAAIAAQTNYLKQVLNHVNPYTKTALKDEPSILFVELVNEPWHHSDDIAGSVKYINALADAVRSTGCDKLLFYNVSQDFKIAEAIRKSTVPGVSFGWYPTGLNAGHELEGNYLRATDGYADMLRPEISAMPKIVYEFDSADLQTGYMYPAMARTFRSVGTQFAAMFAYDMLGTASRNLGWQTHYLSLAYTPRKAMSAIIAAEAMRRLPRLQSYGPYPRNTKFGDFRVSYRDNLGELAAPDAFLYAGSTTTAPPRPERLTRIAGYGSSPVVHYDGLGVYFLDKVRDGVWRLEVYPDAVPVSDPFASPSRDKVVTRAIYRSWPMIVRLPDLGSTFSIEAVALGTPGVRQADDGRVTVTPGVYVLGTRGRVDPGTLPKAIAGLRFDEFHAPPMDSVPTRVVVEARAEYLAEQAVQIGARIVDTTPPDSVTLAIRPAGFGAFRRFAMQHSVGYDYTVSIPPNALTEGAYEYVITVSRGRTSMTFPDGVAKRPWDWDYYGRGYWPTVVVRPTTPLKLFNAAEDVARLAFTRIGDNVRRGIFRVVASPRTGAPAFHVELPVVNGYSPDDYTVSLVIRDRIAARGPAIGDATQLSLTLRGVGAQQVVHVTLMEQDGTSWSAPLAVDSSWGVRSILISDLKPTRGVLLPLGFPGTWNYWVEPADGRGVTGDHIRLEDVERLQLSLRRADATRAQPGSFGVEVESIRLDFEANKGNKDRSQR
jgi:hypothetical protein